MSFERREGIANLVSQHGGHFAEKREPTLFFESLACCVVLGRCAPEEQCGECEQARTDPGEYERQLRSRHECWCDGHELHHFEERSASATTATATTATTATATAATAKPRSCRVRAEHAPPDRRAHVIRSKTSLHTNELM